MPTGLIRRLPITGVGGAAHEWPEDGRDAPRARAGPFRIVGDDVVGAFEAGHTRARFRERRRDRGYRVPKQHDARIAAAEDLLGRVVARAVVDDDHRVSSMPAELAREVRERRADHAPLVEGGDDE